MADLSPSSEQKSIVDAFAAGKNIKIGAVAGAGKSTTLRLCARTLSSGQCALGLTYNKSLEEEMNARITDEKISDKLRVRTFHGAASAAYGYTINNDTKLYDAVSGGAPPHVDRLANVDALLVDEAQDMTIAYYALVRYIIRAHAESKRGQARPLQLVIVGDELQAINRYKSARVEFLLEAERLFYTGREWVEKTLTTSYRLTPAMATFVNRHIVRSPLLVGGNTRAPSIRPAYLAVNLFKRGDREKVAELVKAMVAKHGAENVAILAPSPRTLLRRESKSPIASLVRNHLPHELICITDDDSGANKKTARGKLLITSFNSMKGCERDAVVILGLDESYFQFFDQEWGADRPGVPNILYVAATRAIKNLVIVASPQKTLRTFDDAALMRDASVHGKPKPARALKPIERNVTRSVTDAIRHISLPVVRSAMELIEVVSRRSTKPVARESWPPLTVEFERAGASSVTKYTESVAELYGHVVPALAETARRGDCDFGKRVAHPRIVGSVSEVKSDADITAEAYAVYPTGFWEDVARAVAVPTAERKFRDWFRLAVAVDAMGSGHHNIARQITNYDWVSMEFANAGADVIRGALKTTAGHFEENLPPLTVHGTTLCGRADFVAEGGDIFEFKCAAEVRDEFLIQLAVYLAMSEIASAEPAKPLGHLLTYLSGEIVTIRVRDAEKLVGVVLASARDTNVDILAEIEAFDAQLNAEASESAEAVYECPDDGSTGHDVNEFL